MTREQKVEVYKENHYALAVAICTECSVAQALILMGFTERKNTRVYTGPVKKYESKWKFERSWLLEQKKKGLSNSAIAELKGCSKSTITIAMKQHRIERTTKRGRPNKVKEEL